MLTRTFTRGGASIPHRKSATENKPIVSMPAPEEVVIPLQQHIGAICEPIVKVGDQVKIGQKIGESKQYISAPIHASVSGQVTAIKDIQLVDGRQVPGVVITNDGQDDFYNRENNHINKLSAEQIREVVKEAGIVGMGGAGFPAYVKLTPPKPIDTVLINGAECEPYLTCDHRLMLEFGPELIDGLKTIMQAVGASKGVIGVEVNKPDAIALLRKLTKEEPEIEIVSLKVRYPQGAEKQLIMAALNRQVPSGCLPAEVGCVVNNVHTAIAISQAINEGTPSYQRVVTVAGRHVPDPRNVLVRIGTPISKLIDFCGGIIQQPAAIVAGGPMTGTIFSNLEAPVVKNLSGVLLLGQEEINLSMNNPCIRCAKCVDACPMGLVPNMLALSGEHSKVEELKRLSVMDCIECGLCSYVCPAYRDLYGEIKKGKNAVNSKEAAV